MYDSIIVGKGPAGITAAIYLKRAGYNCVVIGKNGAVLKLIGVRARQDIEEMMQAKVNLQLWVKVKEGWRDNETKLRQIFK